MINQADIGNTLLRGTDGRETAPDYIDAAKTMQIINDALKPCPEIDATTQDMANQAEQAYEILATAMEMTPNDMCNHDLVDLATKAANRISQLYQDKLTLSAVIDSAVNRMSAALDMQPSSSLTDIIAECENIARLAQRNLEFEKLPYVVITHVHSEEISDLAKAKRKAETVANHSSEGHAAIARVVASVKLQPVWSEA